MAWPLKNPKHEKFAQALAAGDTQPIAYLNAGCAKPNSGNAATLAADGAVKARVSALREEAAAAANVSVHRVVAEFARIAFCNVTEAVEVTNGKSLWDANLRAAIAEISEGRDGVRIKLHPKLPALDAIARHLDMFKENIDVNLNVSLAELVAGSYRVERGELQVVDGKMIEVKPSPATPDQRGHDMDATDWRDYASGKKPANIPSNPNVAYAKTGWTGYPDWLVYS
jgi:phage terminase small subunit